MPERVYPVSSESEKEIVMQLVEDLRENCSCATEHMIGLGEEEDNSGESGGISGLGRELSTHLLGEALGNKGRKVVGITAGG
jgi:hypothetical protein